MTPRPTRSRLIRNTSVTPSAGSRAMRQLRRRTTFSRHIRRGKSSAASSESAPVARLFCHPWTPPALQEVSSRPACAGLGCRHPSGLDGPEAAGLDEFRGPAPDHERGLFRPWQATGSADPGPTVHAILDYRPRSPWKPFTGGPPGLAPRATDPSETALTPSPRGSPRRG